MSPEIDRFSAFTLDPWIKSGVDFASEESFEQENVREASREAFEGFWGSWCQLSLVYARIRWITGITFLCLLEIFVVRCVYM
jgi:hypothetical protein